MHCTFHYCVFCYKLLCVVERSEVDEDNAEHEKFAITLRENLIHLMEEKVAEMSNDDMFLPKLKLQETILQFRQIYGAHPMNLVRVIKNSLATEAKLVRDADSVSSSCPRLNINQVFSSVLPMG